MMQTLRTICTSNYLKITCTQWGKVCALSLLILTSQCLQAEDKSVQDMLDDLKAKYKQEDRDNNSIARLKRRLQRINSSSAAIYTMPDGSDVAGLMLDDDTIVPAIVVNNKKYPACIDNNNSLVKGKLNADGKLVCGEIISEDKGNISVKQNPLLTPPDNSKFTLPRNKQVRVDDNLDDTPVIDGTKKVKQANVSASKKVLQTYSLSQKRTEYGVVRGTWLNAKLSRQVTSGETQAVELILEQDLIGKYLTVKAGAKIFCKNKLALSREVLDLNCNLLLTTDDKEVTIDASVYQLNKVAGLSGKLDMKYSDIASNSAIDGVKDVGVALVDAINPIAGNVASDINSQSNKKTIEKIPTITVMPQDVLLKINKKF